MTRHRTTARGLLISLTAAGLAAAALISWTADASGGTGTREATVPRLVFPLVAKTELWDNYGDPRPQGAHEGIDMENPWRAPVVAVEPGRVKYWDSGLGGCMLYLYGESGTMYMYIHLNNDLTPRNDNRGGCKEDVSFAVPNGAKVGAGEQIGFNGDSGDAAGNPHLHFEVHPGGGAAANPFRHLKRAIRPLFAGKPGAPFSLGLRGKLLAAGGGAVELQIERVRHYPGGRWLDVEPRAVELGVSGEAAAATTIAPVAALASKRLRTPLAVTAFTVRAKVTADAIGGAPGSLTIGRFAATG